MFKKFLLSCVAAASLVSSSYADGLITKAIPNTTNWTTVVSAVPVNVYRVDVASTTANLLSFYDSASTNLGLALAAYTRSTNVWFTNTWLTTNGIFEYSTTTQYMIQTNTIAGTYRTNIAVAASTNQLPSQASLYVPAGTIATFDNIDLNFVRGMSVTSTNAATVIVYTRN